MTPPVPQFSGADWLVDALKRQKKIVSPFGRRVADLLGQVVQGIYHVSTEVLEADWSRNDLVVLLADSGWLSAIGTYDCNRMTTLVIGCHDACIRLEVRAAKKPWKLGVFPDSYLELKKLLTTTAPADVGRQDLLVELMRCLNDDDARGSMTKVRRLLRREGVLDRPLKAPVLSDFWKDITEVVHPNDEYAEARNVFDAVEMCGHDGDDLLGQPAMEYVFAPRQPASGSIMLGHPSMEEAVAAARRLFATVMPVVRLPDDKR